MKHAPFPAEQTTAVRRAARGLLSVVIPCHNEEAVIAATHERIAAVLPKTGMDFEILYIDDGSRDGTLAQLESIAARDPRAHVLELARNFGPVSYTHLTLPTNREV